MQGLRSFTARAARALAYQQQARTRISTTSTRCLSTATPYLNPDLPSLNREANSSIAACQTRTTTNYSQPQDGHSIENRTNEHRPSISTPVERLMQGRVVSTKMIRTVKVRVAQQIWNKRLQKVKTIPMPFSLTKPKNEHRTNGTVSSISARIETTWSTTRHRVWPRAISCRSRRGPSPWFRSSQSPLQVLLLLHLRRYSHPAARPGLLGCPLGGLAKSGTSSGRSSCPLVRPSTKDPRYRR